MLRVFKIYYVVFLVGLTLGSNLWGVDFYAPPENDTKILSELGAGLGLPYGFLGGKFSAGSSLLTFDIGLGIIPFVGPSFSAGGSVHFLNRYTAVRPKITAAYSNTAGVILILEEGGTSLYDETFPGVGIYSGFDWRTTKTGRICIDANIGFIYLFVGYDEVNRKYDAAVEDLRERGYFGMTQQSLNLWSPKISVGITYAFGRSLTPTY